MIHLDTSFLIRALVRDSSEDTRLREWIRTDESIGMSAIAWAEFLCGPIDAAAISLASAVVGHRSDFTDEMSSIAARLYNGTGRRRGAMVDCMIAATALSNDAAVATGNMEDFSRFQAFGLALA